MAILKKSTDNKCQRMWRKGNTSNTSWWECKLVQPLQKIWRFFRKNRQLLYDPAIQLLGIYSENNNNQMRCSIPGMFDIKYSQH